MLGKGEIDYSFTFNSKRNLKDDIPEPGYDQICSKGDLGQSIWDRVFWDWCVCWLVGWLVGRLVSLVLS